VAFSGPGEEISETHLAEADAAMYQAKRKGGGGHQRIDLREAGKADDRAHLERDLRAALAAGQLDIAYQPIVRNSDGVVIGVEALLRWTHPQRGLVPPMSMVAIAEQSSLIADIGAWVLERSCRDRGRWLAEHPGSPLDLSVNVSTRQLMSPGFCAAVAQMLAGTGMDAEALVLEMTENILIEDSDRAKTVLIDLKQLGVRIALDDFGTGFSSLSYLRGLPVDIIKIDQAFTGDIGNAPEGGSIVSAITHLAHALGLTVTVEGVETQTQRDEVCAIGCELSQGYFYARPMPATAISSHLSTHTAPPWP
jgi:EAL domain-containing protein (putative c-di-GMP-specific phosphodiesterase class I)